MEIVFDSEIEKGNYQSDVSQTKNYETNGQIFRAHVSSYNQGHYKIDRLAEDGHFENLEGRGDSWNGKISVNYTDVHLLSGETIKANWNKVWEMVEEKIRQYSQMLPALKENKS